MEVKMREPQVGDIVQIEKSNSFFGREYGGERGVITDYDEENRGSAIHLRDGNNIAWVDNDDIILVRPVNYDDLTKN